MKYFFTVGEFDGTLAEFLLSQGVSSRILTSLRKKPGLMLVNGKVAFSDCLVKTGDEVTIDIIDKKALMLVAAKTPDKKVRLIDNIEL